MAKYKYRCTNPECQVELEHVQSMSQPLPKVFHCTKCGTEAEFVVQGAPAFARSTETVSKAPIDAVIGADAEKRWARLRERQAVRNKVRKETGEQALTAIGRDEYQPMKGGHLDTVAIPDDKVNNG